MLIYSIDVVDRYNYTGVGKHKYCCFFHQFFAFGSGCASVAVSRAPFPHSVLLTEAHPLTAVIRKEVRQRELENILDGGRIASVFVITGEFAPLGLQHVSPMPIFTL